MADSKSNRQRINIWDDEPSKGSKVKSKVTSNKEIKLKPHLSYVNSPYMQSLLPGTTTKAVKHVQRKPTYGTTKLNRATFTYNDAAVNNHKPPEKKIAINKQLSESTFRQRPVTSLQCQITLKFVANHSTCFPGRSHQICVQQQHCGGNPICVYQGWHAYGDKFSFTSRRQQGFPFSVTLAINNILNLQLSACCEYKYQIGSKLGGGKSQFMLIGVKGSFPCYRCQIRRKYTKGSITSTQSSEQSKVDDYESDFSNGAHSEYEDDFEEEEETKTSPETCTNDENDVQAANSETELKENINKVTLNTQEETVENETIHEEINTANLNQENQLNCKKSQEFDVIASTQFQPNDSELEHIDSPINTPESETRNQDLVIPDAVPLTLSAKESMTGQHEYDENEEHDANITQEHDDHSSHSEKDESFDDDDDTTNDDAERTVTSEDEPSENSDTDEDVCYSYESVPTPSNSHYQTALSDNERFSMDKTPIYQSNVHFDSSDDEVETHVSPQITIWADVHACELESPAISRI